MVHWKKKWKIYKKNKIFPRIRIFHISIFETKLFFSYRYSRRLPTIVSLIAAAVSLVTLAFVQYWGKYSHVRMYTIFLQLADFRKPWDIYKTWWRHQMETFSALLAICAGNSLVPGEVPAQRPVTRSFDVFFDLHPNKQLSKQWWGWWFETP